MPLLDFNRRSVVLKFVYYGPTGVGKTTSLKLLARRLRHGLTEPPDPSPHLQESAPKSRRRPGGLLCLDTAGERTLFFDTLSMATTVAVGQKETRLVLRLLSVPGGEIHGHTRRLLLRGADGIVLVSDHGGEAPWDEDATFRELRANLCECGIRLSTLPVIRQSKPQGPMAEREVVDALLSLVRAAWPSAAQAAESAGLTGLELAKFLAALQKTLCMSSSAEHPDRGSGLRDDAEKGSGLLQRLFLAGHSEPARLIS
jgi:hypothetical protein